MSGGPWRSGEVRETGDVATDLERTYHAAREAALRFLEQPARPHLKGSALVESRAVRS